MALADTYQAGRYYEDGLARYERNDIKGAIVQLKNALQQDNKQLAAHLLLGKALLKSGELRAAEVALNEAQKQGVSRAEVALPLGQIYMLLGQPQLLLERISEDGLPKAVKVEVLALRAQAYQQLGRTAEATRSFEQARSLDPTSATPLIAEIPGLIAAGQRERAQQLADRAVALAPKNADAWNMQASVFQAAGNISVALAGYGEALALSPKHIDARLARAGIYLDQHKNAEAEKDLEILRQQAPNEARAAYLRAVLAGRHGKSQEVVKELRQVSALIDGLPREWLASREQYMMLGALAHQGLGARQKARTYLDMLITRNGRNIVARRLLASIYLEENDPARATATLEPALRDAPNDAMTLLLLGQAALGSKRYIQATDYLERAVKAGEDNAELRAAMGFSLLGAGQGQEGLRQLELAFARKPGDVRVGLTLATQYMRLGEAKKALAVAEKVAQADPANLATINMLGAVRAAAGDRAGAREAYQRVLTLEPRFMPATLNLARLDVADGKVAQAQTRLQAALNARPDDAAVLYELGLLARMSGRDAEAIRRLDKARALRPREPAAALALVDIYLARSEIAPAIEVARQTASSNADNLDVLAVLARAQLASDDKAGAAQTYRDMTRLADFDANSQVRIGRLQLAAGLVDGAAYNAEKAKASAAQNLDVQVFQGEVLLAQSQLPAAEAAARAVLAKQPGHGAAARLLGDTLLAGQRHEAAAQAYLAAFGREKTTQNALNVARAWFQAGEIKKARSFLDQWLAGAPQDWAARSALAELAMHAKDWRQAKAHYEKILAVHGSDSRATNNLANVLLQLADPAAVATAERAYALAPQDAAVVDTLGWVLVKNGQLDRGLRFLRDARLRAPDSRDTRFHLAWALAQSGRRDEARKELNAAMEGGMVFESLAEARLLQKDLLR